MCPDRKVCWFSSLTALLLFSARASATETEVREFSIHVNGKHSGHCVLHVTKENDGTETVSSKANVRIKILIQSYTFSLQGTETWKNGRLWQLHNVVDDNGKKTEVTANNDGADLRVRVNGREQVRSADVWTNSYWKLAEVKYVNATVPILEADTGKELSRQLQYVGIAPVTLAGRAQNCHHFRLTGGPSPVDLWYDGQFRLVRQEFTEEGFRTILQLTALRRSQP